MIWAGQFGLVEGEAKEESPWVGAYPEPAPRSEEPSDLYLVLEPALPGSEEFLGEMKDAIGASYHSSKISLTGGLLRALRAAHENLREWNRKSLKDHRVAAGVACAAVRGNQAYLALAGPSAAAFYREGTAALVRPTLADATEALGLFDEFWPDFSEFDLRLGDRLLLLSPAFANALPAQDLTAALKLEGEEALPALYRQARALPNCGALLMACVADPVPAAP